MKNIMIVCALAFAACGGGGKKSDTTTNTTTTTDGSAAGSDSATPTGDGQPCTQEIAMVCPEGQIDGCLKQPAEGTTHACVAK